MMGISCEGMAYVYGDNQSVLSNTTIPDSTLKKNSQIIAYHFVQEGTSRDEWRTSYVKNHENVADLMTNLLPSGDKLQVLYDIYSTTSLAYGLRAGDTQQNNLWTRSEISEPS